MLAMVGVAGTAAGVVLAIVRERVDRLADARAARQAAQEQDDSEVVRPGSVETDVVEDESGDSATNDKTPMESEFDESK